MFHVERFPAGKAEIAVFLRPFCQSASIKSGGTTSKEGKAREMKNKASGPSRRTSTSLLAVVQCLCRIIPASRRGTYPPSWPATTGILSPDSHAPPAVLRMRGRRRSRILHLRDERASPTVLPPKVVLAMGSIAIKRIGNFACETLHLPIHCQAGTYPRFLEFSGQTHICLRAEFHEACKYEREPERLEGAGVSDMLSLKVIPRHARQ
jgi:hypothetical protein